MDWLRLRRRSIVNGSPILENTGENRRAAGGVQESGTDLMRISSTRVGLTFFVGWLAFLVLASGAIANAASLPRPSPHGGRTWGFPGPGSFATSGDGRTSASSTAVSGQLSPVTAWCWCGSVGYPEAGPVWDKISILSFNSSIEIMA
jgi:hypothetical protein